MGFNLQGDEGVQEPRRVVLQGDAAQGVPDQGASGQDRDRRRM